MAALRQAGPGRVVAAAHAIIAATPPSRRLGAAALLAIGGYTSALLASVDTDGKPGLWWRTQHAAEDLWSSVENTSKQAMSALGVD